MHGMSQVGAEYVHPLESAKGALLRVLPIVPLVSIVLNCLPRYRCIIQHPESPECPIKIANAHFCDTDQLYLHIVADGWTVDDSGDSTWCSRNVASGRNMMHLVGLPQPYFVSAVLSVQEEPDEKMFNFYNDWDLADSFAELKVQRRQWDHSTADDPDIEASLHRHQIGGLVHPSFRYHRGLTKSTLSLFPRVEMMFGRPYTVADLVQGELIVSLPTHTNIAMSECESSLYPHTSIVIS